MEENKLSIQNEISNEEIKNLIYTIRGKQVMLDSDVAMLYNYETKKVNQAVKRNINRFPERFCFQLTEEELEIMWSQIVTTSKLEDNKYRSKKYLPYVFTEQGIAMLSGILKSEVAVQVSIKIMDAFVEMRKFISINKRLFEKVISIKTNIQNIDIQKFNKEYPILKVARTNKFHDRFIVIDNKEMYHLGSSIKDLGKKCFGINRIEDMEIIEKVINI